MFFGHNAHVVHCGVFDFGDGVSPSGDQHTGLDALVASNTPS